MVFFIYNAMLSDLYQNEVLRLTENLESEDAYKAALEAINWKLLEWNDTPLREPHSHSPIRVKVEDHAGNQKDFIILRSGNSATIAVIKNIDDVPHVLLRNEKKSTGIDIVAMPGGYVEKMDQNISEGALYRLFDEAGVKPDAILEVNNSSAALSNNSTNTSTSFIVELPDTAKTPKGWSWVKLEDAAQLANHMPSQQAAYAACAYKGIIPKHNFTPKL